MWLIQNPEHPMSDMILLQTAETLSDTLHLVQVILSICHLQKNIDFTRLVIYFLFQLALRWKLIV